MSARRGARHSIRRGIAGAIVAVAAIVTVPAVAGLGSTEAAWTDSEYANATPTAGTLLTLTKVAGCQLGLLGSSTTVNWTNPTGGVQRTGIVWGLYTQPGNVLVAPETFTSGAGASTSTQLVVPNTSGVTTAGTYTLRVQTYVGSWRSPAVTGSIRFTTGVLGTAMAECTWVAGTG